MYNPLEIQRIDRQIEDLQRLKANYQNIQQPQPAVNNFISQPQQQVRPIFEARFTNENPADIFVSNKTAFIDLKNGKLTIKEVDGEMKEYFLLLPKDEKDLKIENLERKVREMEVQINKDKVDKKQKEEIKQANVPEYDNLILNDYINPTNEEVNTNNKKNNKFKFKN